MLTARQNFTGPSEYSGTFGISIEWPALTDFGTHGFRPGTEIFAQGEIADSVYLLRHGLVKLVYASAEGRESIMGLRADGWPLGAAAVILEKPYPYTAVAVNYSRLTRIPADAFRNLAQSDPEILNRILVAQCEELYDGMSAMACRVTDCARDRLVQFLSRLVPADTTSASKKNIRLHIPIKGWEIAQVIGVTPPFLSQILGDLEQDGVIERRKGWLHVVDSAALLPVV